MHKWVYNPDFVVNKGHKQRINISETGRIGVNPPQRKFCFKMDKRKYWFGNSVED